MAETNKIIVIGAGTVGRHISELLQNENCEVVIVDRDPAKIEELSNSLDVQTLLGHGANPSVQLKAGAGDANLVLALTNDDEINLLCAFTARRLGARQCVARARSPWYLENRMVNHAALLGIDHILNPEQLTALEMIRFIDNPEAIAMARFAHGRVQLRTLTLDAKSEFAGKELKNCRLPTGVLVAMVTHEGEATVPRGDTRLETGDKITIMGLPNKVPEAQRLFHVAVEPVRNVAIAGGGATGLFLAQALEERKFNVKLIENDRHRCEELSEALHKTQVVHGDATDNNFLREERIGRNDVFIGSTGDDETNLMACLLARDLGVEQTVARIGRPDYASLVQKFGVTLALSPRHIMAERILKLVSRGFVQAISLLEDGRVEAIELIVGHGSALTGKPLKDLKLPPGTLIGAIVHLGETIIPRGENRIDPGDTVIAVGLRDAMDKLENLFHGH